MQQKLEFRFGETGRLHREAQEGLRDGVGANSHELKRIPGQPNSAGPRVVPEHCSQRFSRGVGLLPALEIGSRIADYLIAEGYEQVGRQFVGEIQPRPRGSRHEQPFDVMKLAWTDPHPMPDDALPAHPRKMVRLAEVQ